MVSASSGRSLPKSGHVALSSSQAATLARASRLLRESTWPDRELSEFAILLRVPVVENQTLSSDLQDPSAELYEWPPNQDGAE